jgi:hypothetical protein
VAGSFASLLMTDQPTRGRAERIEDLDFNEVAPVFGDDNVLVGSPDCGDHCVYCAPTLRGKPLVLHHGSRVCGAFWL